MRLLVVVLLVAGLAGAYNWWEGPGADADGLSGLAGAQDGFVPVQMPDGAPPHAVLVVTPEHCPSEQARRAEALIDELGRQGVPVARSSSISFEVVNPTADQRKGVKRAIAVFNHGAPAVFVNGMAMSNPTASQTVAEYRRTRARP